MFFMGFSKNFPREVKGSNYPKWEEVVLTPDEESLEEQKCRKENIAIMQECITDAMKIMDKKELKRFQTDMVNIAISLFEKRASHVVYWKENRAKEKFDLNHKSK